MSVFDQMISRYDIRTENDRRNAIHEVMQEIALAGLCSTVNKYGSWGNICKKNQIIFPATIPCNFPFRIKGMMKILTLPHPNSSCRSYLPDSPVLIIIQPVHAD